MTEKPDIQDYELIAPIGEGGFGEVWLAKNVLEVFHAIKVVKWPESSKEDHEKKLRHYQAEFNGIKAYAPISQKHDGLLDIYHAGIRESEGYYYYVLPLADDLRLGSNIDPDNYSPKTLANYLEASEEGRLSPEESIEIIRQVAFALHQLHGEGVVHRDIKPDNIICVNDRWHLGDIGLVAGQGAESFVGSLGYLAPEGPGKPVADIFSLGKVLYAICTGKTPDSFPDYPTWAFANRAEQNEFQEVNIIFCKACEFAPKDRYQNTLELLEALQATDESTSATQKHPSFALKIGIALAISLISIILFFVVKHRPPLSSSNQTERSSDKEASADSSLPKGLKLYYPFNGNSIDESGNGNHGTVNGAKLTRDRHGVDGKAYQLTLSTTDITTPYVFKSGAAPRTISMWFKPDSLPPSAQGFFQGHGGVKRMSLLHKVSPAMSIWDNGTIGFDGPARNAVYTGNPLTVGKWHHLVLSYSGQINTMKVWVDGKALMAQKTGFWDFGGPRPFRDTTSPLKIPGFNGSVDDLRVYDRALSVAEVAKLHALEKP
jgi:serine/threonine protein kinase